MFDPPPNLTSTTIRNRHIAKNKLPWASFLIDQMNNDSLELNVQRAFGYEHLDITYGLANKRMEKLYLIVLWWAYCQLVGRLNVC